MKNNIPTRIADVIGGHIHPAICVTQSGTLLAVYNKEGGGGKELLLSRSNDGGMTWSPSTSIPVIRNCSIYPGSLVTLSDGRILLNWSCYHKAGRDDSGGNLNFRSAAMRVKLGLNRGIILSLTAPTIPVCAMRRSNGLRIRGCVHSMIVPFCTIWGRIRLGLLGMDGITAWCRLCAHPKEH